MTAHTYREAVVHCNAVGCPQAVFGSHLDLPDRHTAADVRRLIRRRGWAVSVAPEPGTKPRRDFCPEHNPERTQT